MSKTGGNLGEQGCVNWMFEKKGTITISKEDIDRWEPCNVHGICSDYIELLK